MVKRIGILLIITGIILSLLGCGNEETVQGKGEEPFTISVYKTGLNLTETEFQTFFIEPVKKKYPNITLKLIVDEKGATPEELLAANSFPDIIFTSNPSYFRLQGLNVVNGLDDLVKKNHFDLNRIKPVITDSIKLYSSNNELIALPFSLNVAALFYNKDIFDKFGVEYPNKVMTWEETLRLARQLTRTEGGINYVGIDLTGPTNIARGLSLPLIDPQTGNAAVQSEPWVRVFQLLKESYEIPGYIGENDRHTYGNKAFLQERNLAMLPNWLGGLIGPLQELSQQGTGLNWDVAPLPNFPEAIGTGREIDIHSMMLSKLSPHKEQAFQVMTYMLSEEVQRIIAKSGRMSVLDNPQLEKEFGTELESLKGKQIENVFKALPRKLHIPSEFDKDVATKKLEDAAKEVATGKADVNSALRNVQSAIDKEIQSLKATDRTISVPAEEKKP
ncbi:ABC transporter substrate-binding protein [Paenibacillus sp. NPDC056579]|uniref:ABC transporter substrate-binding protein n=1 Tax=Paenibacillus sp. NPDC056579 TaxID=3345871 RepID=UPI0036CCE4C4